MGPTENLFRFMSQCKTQDFLVILKTEIIVLVTGHNEDLELFHQTIHNKHRGKK